MSGILDLVLLATGCFHVYIAPYTKVEESFNLHATHDILMYGTSVEALTNYDHFVFPGAVPRTFVGSALLAWLSQLVIPIAKSIGFLNDKSDLQLLVRFVLATYNCVGFWLLRRAVSRRYGGTAGVLFVLLTCTQFHLPFWMSRTLPNMFALLPVNIALYCLYDRAPNALRPSPRKVHIAIALLTFASVVFRAELVMFLGPLVLQSLISGYTTFKNVIKVGLVAGVASVALTVAVDSYFWQYPIWPELYGIYFNVVQGKSSEWGVSPFHTYFTSYLPKLLLSSSALSIVGAVVDHRIRSLLWPAITFILLMSALGHKESRFIIYVVPVFNIAAARGSAWLITRRKNRLLGRLYFLTVVGLLAANCLATALSTAMSAANYPGGVALQRFNDMYHARENVHVHISNLAAQTGASLFLQTHAPPYLPYLPPPSSSHWTYNKTEHLTPTALTASRSVTHVIAELSHSYSASESYNGNGNGARNANAFDATGFPKNHWRLTGVVTAFEGLERDFSKETLSKRPWEAVRLVKSEQLAILERK